MPTASTRTWSIASERKADAMSTDQSTPLAAEKKPASGRTEAKSAAGAAGSPALPWRRSRSSSSRTAASPSTRASPTRTCRAGRARSGSSSGWTTSPSCTLPPCVMLLVLLVVFIRGWRRNPGSPVMLMFLCTTLIVWQDPIMNWSPFAVYNPDLIHWPESWPLVSLSPTVEPFVVFGYVMFYFGPYFPAVWILRKLQAKYGPEAFVSRHPLVSLGLLTLVIGFVFDAWLEIQLVHTGMYIYSQVIPWGSVFTGTTFQFPLIWESFSVTFVMMPGGDPVLPRRHREVGGGEAGRESEDLPDPSGAGHLPGDVRHHQRVVLRLRRVVRAIKVSQAATSVACPWPYPEAKVYDPQGFYEKAGAQGPYSVGIWSTWASGEPNGRPHVDPPPPGAGRLCEQEWLSRAPSSSPVRPADSGSPRPCACIARGGAWSRPCGHPTAGCRCCGRRPGPATTTTG